MRKLLLALTILPTLFLGGLTPSPIQQGNHQRDLDALTKRGFTYRVLDNDLIELTDPLSGEKHVKSLREPSEATIRAWAVQRGIPILEIDPNTIDTSKYGGWFNFWGRVPVSSNPGQGEPLIVGDLDRNGQPEVYGLYWDNGLQQKTRVYEVDAKGIATLKHDYSPIFGIPIGLIDADRDSLAELSLFTGDSTLYFEQPAFNMLPTDFRFGHRHIEGNVFPANTHIVYTELDGDTLIDLLYKGSERDSVDTTYYRTKVFVSEYKPQVNNFVRVWSTSFGLQTVTGIGGFTSGDFDGDGKAEFAVGELTRGRVYVAENTDDDSFAVTWTDSVPFSNVYYVGSGDVDHDGLPEVLVGATISNGDWFTMFEADSDNDYSAKFLFHLLAGGTFDNPQILTTDVDGDGRLELVICAGANIFMFQSDNDNTYYLWYLKRGNARDGIHFYDFNGDGRKDMIVGKTIYVDPPGYFRSFADIYIATSLVSVDDRSSAKSPDRFISLSNYPNPFNPSTTIRFLLPDRSSVSIKIHDVLGKEVEDLFEETVNAGTHTVVWSAEGRSSGIYICRLIAGKQAISRKFLLIH